MAKPKHAIIDGDVIAFRAAAGVENTIEWPSGYVERFARRADGEAAVDGMIANLIAQLHLDSWEIALSCPSEENWRLEVEPTYKGNRKDSVRPLLLEKLKDYLRDKYAAFHWPRLEADDVVGIRLTQPHVNIEVLSVGKDKDFYTVPGQHFQIGDLSARTVNARTAALFHYQQTLSGDPVDGYAGCPGIGKKRAIQIVENPRRLINKPRPVTRGVNKGQIVPGWTDAGPCSVWEAIVCNYEKAGLEEKDAIKTARLANILQAHQYNMETGEITLWVPGKE